MAHEYDLDQGDQVNSADTSRVNVKGRKTPMDYITIISGICGAIAGLTVLTGSVTDALPYVQKTPYAKDWAANDVRMQQGEAQVKTLTDNVSDVIKTGELSLQIQLQTRVDALAATLRSMPLNSPDRAALKSTYDDMNQRLTILNRKLDR